MAFLGTLCCGIHRLLRTSSPIESEPVTGTAHVPVLRRSVPSTFAFSALLAAIGVSVSGALPQWQWLGGDSAIRSDASLYFLIFSLFLPILQMNFLAAGMLRCSGNMRIPSIAGVLMCILDVVFNFFLIFHRVSYP